jgi:hypothetical protein
MWIGTDFHACTFGDGAMCTYIDPLYLFAETIHIIRGPSWDLYLQAYAEGKKCGAIALAGSLLHELWHMVREYRFEDSFADDNCTEPVLLENLFRWAIYQRCPGVLHQDCCAAEWLAVQTPYEDVLVYPC